MVFKHYLYLVYVILINDLYKFILAKYKIISNFRELDDRPRFGGQLVSGQVE
jgi:hypothetical protein